MRNIKSDRYQEDVLETYLTPAYAEDRLYDDLYDCQKHNYLVRKYFKEGLRGDDLINAVTDTINEDIADWDCTAWQGLDEEADEFDPQDLYDESIQSSRRIRSSYPKNAEQNKFNWAYNSSLKGKDDLQPYEYEYIRWYNKNENEPWMKELCEKYDCYPLGDTEKAAFGSALREIGEIQSSRKNIRSSQKGFENVADNTQYDDYHIDTRGMGILDVENIVGAIESRGNQAVLTVNCSDGSAYHTQFTSKDWKEFKESKNASGAQITDVWITEVNPTYVRSAKAPTESRRMIGSKFERTARQDVVAPYQNYYSSISFDKEMNKYFERYNLPYDILSVKYNENTRTLVINVQMYLKAYGNSYSTESHNVAERSPYKENAFFFDKSVSQNESEILFPMGLVKMGRYYPTTDFHYSDYGIRETPMKLHWVDRIELNIFKNYD